MTFRNECYIGMKTFDQNLIANGFYKCFTETVPKLTTSNPTSFYWPNWLSVRLRTKWFWVLSGYVT